MTQTYNNFRDQNLTKGVTKYYRSRKLRRISIHSSHNVLVKNSIKAVIYIPVRTSTENNETKDNQWKA